MKSFYWKWLLTIIGALYCIYYFSSIDQWHFIDNVNLVIHEAGHVVFMFFGTFIYIAGGSLMQLIMPTLFIGYFFWTDQMYSGSLMFYWLAVNFFNVARYAADARVMQLELLGGDSSGHDWHNMLSMLHLLNWTSFIAGLIFCFGFIAIGLGGYFAYVAISSNPG